METQTPQHQGVEVRAPYYVGIADLDELIGLWTRARSIDEAIDPVMLVASRSTSGHTIITETRHTVVSWISPTGTCFIWELRTALTLGTMGFTGFSAMDPENHKESILRASACCKAVQIYLEGADLFILSNAAVAIARDLVLPEANRPDFLVFNKELNCLEPAYYAPPTDGG